MTGIGNGWRNIIQTIDQSACTAKAGIAVAAGSIAWGGAIKFDIIREAIGTYSVGNGAATGTVVFIIQLVKMLRVVKAWWLGHPDPKD